MKKFLLLTWILAVAQFSIFSGHAHAMDQDTRTLVRGATYGLVGGTIVGAAVLPLTGSDRGVFIGSSLGLYMGIIMGVYRITHRPSQGDGSGSSYRSENDESQGPQLAQISPFAKPLQARGNPRTPMEMPLRSRFAFSMPVIRF